MVREFIEMNEGFRGVTSQEYHDADASDGYNGEVVHNWLDAWGGVNFGGCGIKGDV